MKNTTKQEITARCAYFGAKARFYGETLHLDFLGGTWPNNTEGFDLEAQLAEVLSWEGYEVTKLVCKNYTLVAPRFSTDPSAFDLSGEAYDAQKETI